MEARAYACYNKNINVRMNSSSGGIFYLFAQTVIRAGGVVFGARFNGDWEVEHGWFEEIKDISSYMQSKYVQSDVGDTYQTAKKFLESGRSVLYSGTPCQISGLKTFLGKEYSNLMTIDFICHGVPSPMIWRRYLSEISAGKVIKSISFRDKTEGWMDFSLKIDYQDGSVYRKTLREDVYMQGFLQDLYLRPSCYECSFRGIKRDSDITLADFWNGQKMLPNMVDNKGTSVLLVHTEKGEKILEDINAEIEICEVPLEFVKSTNSAIEKSCEMNPKRMKFYASIHKGMIKAIKRQTQVLMWVRIKRKIKRLLKYLNSRLGDEDGKKKFRFCIKIKKSVVDVRLAMQAVLKRLYK